MSMENVLLMMDLGTLNKMRDIDRESQHLAAFQGKKLIFTGWDFKGHGRVAAEKYDVHAIVCESSILYMRPRGGWVKEEPKRVLLFGELEKAKVKHANFEVMKQLNTTNRNDVLYSQGNEIGICYYINPPDHVLKKLEPFTAQKPIDVNAFRSRLINFGTKADEVEIVSNHRFLVRDTVDNRYRVEKVNALYSTFRPYCVAFDNEKITVEREARQETVFKYKDIQKIVDETWLSGTGRISLDEYLRIVPQDDFCIDIFPRTKRESWRDALKESGLQDVEYIFCVSAKTESDIPFIVNGYHERGFYALAPTKMPDGLRHAGVIPAANTITEALAFVQRETQTQKV